MKKSAIRPQDGHLSFEISDEDLVYTIDELEKLYTEGGQFSLRVQGNNQDAIIIFQKVRIQEDQHIEVINEPTNDSIWSSVFFLSTCLFCLIAILYGIDQLFL